MPIPTVSVMVRGWNAEAGVSGQMVLETAKRVEDLGLDGIVVGDHVTFFGGGNDGIMLLTAMAAVTERVELKTCVYLLPLRHPVPVAQQVAQLDQLSDGRFVFGVGIGGEDPNEFWSCGVDPSTRGARTNEALEIVKRLLVEDGVHFKGRHFEIENASINPKPLRPTPIFIGGRSDAALIRTGRFGDGYTGIWQSVKRFAQSQEVVAEAAAAADRADAAMEFGMQFWTSVADSTSTARDLVGHRMGAMYKLPFEQFERYTPYGTARQVAEFVAPYAEAGARHVNLIVVQDSAEEEAERAAEVRQELHTLLV
jgi:probable F420-dependent oxidoreductase